MRKHGLAKVQTPPSTPFPEITFNNETPNRIFQILDRKSRNLIFTWPDTSNDSYNKNDFSRLVKNVILDSNNLSRNNNLAKGTNNLDVESPNCLRLVPDKHFIFTSGTYRQIQSVVIPYGDIIFACFQILPSTTLGKARSAPCSPAAINNNNGIVKRPRSPGSLSPLPSPFYDDEIRRYVQNHHSNSSHYSQEVPDFIIDKRSSKRHRIDPPSVSSAKDSFVPVKITYSPPNTPQLLLNPISPRVSPSYHHDQQQRCQFPFPSQIITSKDQSSQTLQPPQQPYYSYVASPPGPQSRQPSPKQQDYPSPKNHPSQFLSQSNNHHVVQPQQSPPSSQSSSSVAVVPPSNQSQQQFTQFAPQQRSRNNNGNSGNNSNSSNNNNNNSNNNVQGAKKCESCHTSSSPEWRRGPTGHKT
jgi:hypothetical protein